MKKQRLLLLFGGLLIMIMMTACKDSKIPENRTKKEYQAEQKHPETELKGVSYKIPINSEIVAPFIKQLNIKNPKKSSISVTKTESKEYYYTISIDTDSEIYSIFEGITLEDVKEFSK